MNDRIALSTAEVAELVGVSPYLIRQHLADGSLPSHYIGTRRRIRRVDVEKWLESLPTERAAS